jgi:hypothetical protein
MTSILKADTIQDTDGNNIINENSNTITIGASGDTITIPAGATITNSGTATGFGESNTPSFRAYNSGTFSFSSNSTTKMRMDRVAFDTDGSAFDTSDYDFTVPSGQGGKYFLNASLRLVAGTNCYAAGYFYVNGGEYMLLANEVRDDYSGALIVNVTGTADLNAGDIVDVRCNSNLGSPEMDGSTSYSQGRYSFFEGFKISS